MRNPNVGIAIAILIAVLIASIGVMMTIREGWGAVASQTGRPYSERQMLLPYPNYDTSTYMDQPVGPTLSPQQFYVKNRLSSSPYNLYSYRPDLTIPSFQPPPEYRRVGIVFDAENTERKLPLFGRPVIPGGNRFDYYVLDDSIHTNPLPLVNHNGLELVSGNRVRVQGFHNPFNVYVYYE